MNTTTIAFSVLSFCLWSCGFGFRRAIRKTRDHGGALDIGFLLSRYLYISSLQNLSIAIGAYLFQGNQNTFLYFLTISHFLLAMHASFSIYILYFIFFPKTPWRFPVFSLMLFGLIGTILTVTFRPQVMFTASNGVDWFLGVPLSLFIIPLLMISLGSLSFIFVRLFFVGKNTKIKALSFFVSVFAFIGIYNIFTRFVLFYRAPPNVRASLFDNIISFSSVIFVVSFITLAIPLRTKGTKKNL